MRTILEIPDPLFRKAKAAAAARGQTLKQLVNEALRDKLADPLADSQPGWQKLFGTMKVHTAELRRIETVINDEFGRIDLEAWK